MPQITTITSEAIQATIRRLLPSQRGFGIDMEATNVITPVIDITPTAEGSQLPSYLAQASGFQSTPYNNLGGTTTDIVTGAGFYRFIGSAILRKVSTGAREIRIEVNDGSVSNQIWRMRNDSGTTGDNIALPVDLIVFLRSTDTLKAICSSTCTLTGSISQIADVYGNIKNPLGFTFE